jgi:hypothetical protein
MGKTAYKYFEIISLLEQQGFTLDFSLTCDKRLLCMQSGQIISDREITLTEKYHLNNGAEGQCFRIYAVEALGFALKGILLTK